MLSLNFGSTTVVKMNPHILFLLCPSQRERKTTGKSATQKLCSVNLNTAMSKYWQIWKSVACLDFSPRKKFPLDCEHFGV